MPEESTISVLLVEDDKLLGELTLEILVDAGYRAMHVEDANQAIDLLRRERFDILLSDIVIPGGLSGIELIQQIEMTHPKTCCILTTGYAASVALPESFKRRVIYKPYDADTLLKTMHRLLQPSNDR